MPIQRHTTEYSDAYLDISLYNPPHQFTEDELELFFISPRPQFPPRPQPRRPEESLFLITSLDDFFAEIIEEAIDEVEIDAVADPIACNDIRTAFFNATNIVYGEKEKNFDEQAALLQKNDEINTPKKRQWRKNMVWKKEDQVENQSNKRKNPPVEPAHHLDKEPAVKRQVVHQHDANIQPRQYAPSPFKRNWRYNRVWRKDMVWKREEKTSLTAKQADHDNQKDIVVSPGTKHDVIPFNIETTPIQGEKKAFLKDCTALKRKRQESFITSIPSKRRLLEAIPWRSVRPHATPRFLWNLETEMELCCDLFEDLHV